MNSININIFTSSTNRNMINTRCRGFAEFSSSILACKMAFSFLRLEIETLQTFKSLVLEINLSFSILRLANDLFNLSILAIKLALSFLRFTRESSQTFNFSTLASNLAFSFLRLETVSWQMLSSLDKFHFSLLPEHKHF
jgi:hypothetical protein